MIYKGDKLTIRPEYADAGDNGLTWIATDDEEKGRVTIEALTNQPINPSQVVRADMVELTGLAAIRERYGLEEIGTGGGATALFLELNTNQDHVLITDNDGDAPTDDSPEFGIAVFLHADDDEPDHYFLLDNLEALNETLHAVCVLWGYL